MGVPNTNTFTLQDVVNEVNPPVNSLQSCFNNANSAQFDSNYSGSKDRLSNFRNYGNAVLAPDVISVSVIYDPLLGVASLTGEVTNENNASVTATGFWYRIDNSNVNTNPLESYQVTSTDTGLGQFNAGASVRSGNNTMYVRAYATNSAGTTHASNVVSVLLL